MKDYWVIYEFQTKKASAKKSLECIRKKFPKAYIEETHSMFVITVAHLSSKEEADKLVSKLYSTGYYGGIYDGVS